MGNGQTMFKNWADVCCYDHFYHRCYAKAGTEVAVKEMAFNLLLPITLICNKQKSHYPHEARNMKEISICEKLVTPVELCRYSVWGRDRKVDISWQSSPKMSPLTPRVLVEKGLTPMWLLQCSYRFVISPAGLLSLSGKVIAICSHLSFSNSLHLTVYRSCLEMHDTCDSKIFKSGRLQIHQRRKLLWKNSINLYPLQSLEQNLNFIIGQCP